MEFCRYHARVEDTWPEEELLVETAARISREERSEMVARAHRPFWAEEIILAELNKKIDLRKDLKTWSKMILKETVTKVTQVVMIRDLLKNIADRAVYEHDRDTKNKDTKKAEGEEDEVQVTKTARKRKRDDEIGQTRSTPGGETSTRSQGSPRKEEKR